MFSDIKPGYTSRCVSAEVRSRLAAERKSGLKFAAEVGMSQNYLATRLRDEKPFTVDDVEAMCDQWDIEPGDFVTKALDSHGEFAAESLVEADRKRRGDLIIDVEAVRSAYAGQAPDVIEGVEQVIAAAQSHRFGEMDAAMYITMQSVQRRIIALSSHAAQFAKLEGLNAEHDSASYLRTLAGTIRTDPEQADEQLEQMQERALFAPADGDTEKDRPTRLRKVIWPESGADESTASDDVRGHEPPLDAAADSTGEPSQREQIDAENDRLGGHQD